jgi:hypothetical protein
MERLYRQHLIFPLVFFDSAIGDWTASVHIEFTEELKVHTVVIRSSDAFQSEVQAKKFIIDQPKQWVDERLGSARIVQSRRKHTSLGLGVYGQCIGYADCKNNRHDLCLNDSSSQRGHNHKDPLLVQVTANASASRHIGHRAAYDGICR